MFYYKPNTERITIFVLFLFSILMISNQHFSIVTQIKVGGYIQYINNKYNPFSIYFNKM